MIKEIFGIIHLWYYEIEGDLKALLLIGRQFHFYN